MDPLPAHPETRCRQVQLPHPCESIPRPYSPGTTCEKFLESSRCPGWVKGEPFAVACNKGLRKLVLSESLHLFEHAYGGITVVLLERLGAKDFFALEQFKKEEFDVTQSDGVMTNLGFLNNPRVRLGY